MKTYIFKIDAKPYTVKLVLKRQAESWGQVLLEFPNAEYVTEY